MINLFDSDRKKQAVIACLDACVRAAETGDRGDYSVAWRNLGMAVEDFNAQCEGVIYLYSPNSKKVKLSL